MLKDIRTDNVIIRSKFARRRVGQIQSRFPVKECVRLREVPFHRLSKYVRVADAEGAQRLQNRKIPERQVTFEQTSGKSQKHPALPIPASAAAVIFC